MGAISEREKRVLHKLLAEGKITEDDLLAYDYYEREVKEIKYVMNWKTICFNVDKEAFERDEKLIAKALGEDWKDKYDYSEGRKKGTYDISVYVTDEEYEKIIANS